MKLFGSRVNLDATYYNNLTKDALIAQPIAASAGASQLTVTRNLGSVRNSGIEATVTATLLDTRNFGWDMTVGGSHNTNIIESLGVDAQGVPNPTIGTGSTRSATGFPISGVYARTFTYADANGNGIIEPSEVTVQTTCAADAGPNCTGGGFVFLGYAVPRDLVSIQNGFDLFQRKLHINVLLDYKGGFSLFNNSVSFYCQQSNVCHDEAVKSTPLADQARSVAQRYPGTTTQFGFWENGQFWRLREIGATLTVPKSISDMMRSRDASLTFTARNLHVWTAYKGTDPESNYSTGNVQTDFSTTSPPSYATIRLNLHY